MVVWNILAYMSCTQFTVKPLLMFVFATTPPRVLHFGAWWLIDHVTHPPTERYTQKQEAEEHHIIKNTHAQQSWSSDQPRISARDLHQEGETQSDITHDHCDGADHVRAGDHTTHSSLLLETNEQTYSGIIYAPVKVSDLHVKWLPPQQRTRF